MSATSFNNFGSIAAGMVAELDQIVRDTAQEIRTNAAAGAPIDTGALQASLYVSDDQHSNYIESALTAQGLRHSGNRPGSEADVVGEEKPEHEHEAVIGSAVAHGLVNEFGGATMPARPFLVPAVEQAAPGFHRRIDQVLNP